MGKHLNFVHNDEIWKDHVAREMQSASYKWPGKWGFLVKEYKHLNADLDGRSPTPPEAARKLSKQVCKLPPIKGAQPSKKFPVTTAQLIGWKSTRAEYSLENHGKHKVKARGNLCCSAKEISDAFLNY